MGLKMLSAFRNFIGELVGNIAKFPRWAIDNTRNLINHFKEIRQNLKNMTKTNLDLGIYHFYSNNLNDAIFRFRLVERFFDPANKQACYYLGWCYMQKGEIKKAMEYLVKAGDEDVVNLRQFLRTIDIAQQVPNNIEQVIRDIRAENYIEDYVGNEVYLPKELVNELNVNMLEVPEQYEILELGSNIGACGAQMRSRLPEKFTLTGVENSASMISILQELENIKEEKNYSQLINLSVPDFLDQNDKKYDVIVSLNGFSFTAELDSFFSKVRSALTDKGVFAFTVKIDEQTVIDKEYLEFNYSQATVISALNSNNFEIIAKKELKLEKNNSFYIFVVKLTRSK